MPRPELFASPADLRSDRRPTRNRRRAAAGTAARIAAACRGTPRHATGSAIAASRRLAPSVGAIPDFANAPFRLGSLAPRSVLGKRPMNEQRPRVVAVGEALIEFVRGGDGRFGIGCAGDTFNVT